MAIHQTKVRVRVGERGELHATQVDPERETYQLLQYDGRRRYHALSVRAAQWGEIVLTLPTDVRALRARRMQFAGPGIIASAWCGQRADGASVSGSSIASPAAVKAWQLTTDNGRGTRTETNVEINDDGSTSRVDTSRDAQGNVTGRTVTESRKGARDVETYDANNQKTSESAERSKYQKTDGEWTFTTDRRVDNFDENGNVTQTTTTRKRRPSTHRGTRVARRTRSRKVDWLTDQLLTLLSRVAFSRRTAKHGTEMVHVGDELGAERRPRRDSHRDQRCPG
jgi:hypothetical protein